MEGPDAGRGNVRPLRPQDAEREQRLWARLRAAASPEAFHGAWLELQCAALDGVRAAVVLASLRPGGPLEPVASWPSERRPRAHLIAAAQRVSAERRALALQLGPKGDSEPGEARTVLARPVESGERLCAVVAVEVSPRPQAELEAALRQLAWGSAWLQSYDVGGIAGAGRGARLKELLDLVATAFEQDRFRAAATAFATAVGARFECERVSLGFVERGQVALAAVSHSAQFDPRANLSRAVEAAMSEALDQGGAVLWPAPLGAPPRVDRHHAELAKAASAGSVATLPIACGDRHVGAITLERSAPTPLSPSEVELLDAALAFVGPLLEAQRRDDRWLGAKVRESLHAQARRLLGPGHVGAKLAAAALVTLVLGLVLVKGDYRVSADGVLEASVLRAATAPFDGYIAESGVRAGDVVSRGTLLARLDDRDLVLERARFISQIQQLEKQRRQAIADRDVAKAEIHAAQRDQVRAQLDLVLDRLTRLRLEAPFDGIVVSGDLTQSLGSPIERGQVLFELAPLDDYRVALQVEERDVADLRVGQAGSLVFFAAPGQRVPIEIETITPVSESGEGSNRFRVDARLAELPPQLLRPGMEGVAKITVDRRRLIWIWTRDALDWLRLTLWSWLP